MPPGKLLPLAALFILLALATAAQAYQQRLSQPVLLPSARGLNPVLLTSRGPVPLPWMPAPSGTVTHVVYTNITWHGRPLSQLPPREAARILREAARHDWRLPGLRVEEGKLTLLSYRPGEESIVVLLPVRLDARPLAPREALEEAARLGAKQVYTAGGAAIALVASPRAPMLPPLGPRDHVAIAVTGPWGTAVFRATGSQLLHPAQAQKLQPPPSILSTKPASLRTAGQAPSQAWPGPASQQESMLIDVVPWSDVHYQDGEAPSPLVEHIQLGAWRRWLLSHRAYTPPRTTRMTLTFIATSSKSNIFILRMSLNSDTLLDPVAAIEPGARYIAQLVYYTTPQPSTGPENTIRVEVDAPSQPVDMKTRILLTAVSVAGPPTPDNAVAEAESTAYGIVGVENGQPVITPIGSTPRVAHNPGIAIPTSGSMSVPLIISPSILNVNAYISASVQCTYSINSATIALNNIISQCIPVDSHRFVCNIGGLLVSQQLWKTLELGQPLFVTISVDPRPHRLYQCVIDTLTVRYKTRARAFFTARHIYKAFSSYPLEANDYEAANYIVKDIIMVEPFSSEVGSPIQHAAAVLSIYGWRPVYKGPQALELNIYVPISGLKSKPFNIYDYEELVSTHTVKVSGTVMISPSSDMDKPLSASIQEVKVYALGSGTSDEYLVSGFSIVSYMLGAISLLMSGNAAAVIGIAGQLIATPALFYHNTLVGYSVWQSPRGDIIIEFDAYPDWRGTLKGVRIYVNRVDTPTAHWHGGLNVWYSLAYELETDMIIPRNFNIYSEVDFSGSVHIPILK